MPNRRAALAALLGTAAPPWAARAAQGGLDLIRGVVWQPSAHAAAPEGSWQQLGARSLLVQWSVVDDMAYLPGLPQRSATPLPDWRAITRQPWAREVILGLAGRFDGHAARRDLATLGAQSIAIVRSKPATLQVAAWYFPVEADPTWADVRQLRPVLAPLPRPLWVSAYDNGNIGPAEFASWVAGWLPAGVGVMFQDGVGLYTRRPEVAVLYDDALVQRLGRQRVRLIAEAFRAEGLGNFVNAPAAELIEQLHVYRGRPVFLFEGPRYVPDAVVAQIVARCAQGAAC